MRRFRELLQYSFKSADTEEWLDVWFTRPVGLVFAILWMRLKIHPNVVTVVGIVLGMAGGCMFYFRDLTHNILGVALMMLANFCDSTDGQMARITGQKTLVGRVLDGFASDAWFFCVYWAIVFRLWPQTMPFVGIQWGPWAFVLCAVAGFVCHSTQCALADYYRQIHLYFLLGREGSELDDYASQRAIYDRLPRKGAFVERCFYFFYAGYCRKQERLTPAFQQLYRRLRQLYDNPAAMPQQLRDDFRAGSLPLMKYTNLLTHNSRAITLFVACLLDVPYVYPLFEIVALTFIYVYMHRQHETLCRQMYAKYCT